jgi:hypothetical protein
MSKTLNNVKTFPLPDTHLNGVVVLACSIIDQQESTGELREQVVILRGMFAELRDVVRWMVAEVSDLLTRQDTALQLAVAAREHPTFKVPEWFFQLESDNLKTMLTRRAEYLSAAKLDLDATWDLLREFCESCYQTITEAELSAILEQAHAGKKEAR